MSKKHFGINSAKDLSEQHNRISSLSYCGKRSRMTSVEYPRPINLRGLYESRHQKREALARLAAGETQSDIARTFAVDRAVICRLDALGSMYTVWSFFSLSDFRARKR